MRCEPYNTGRLNETDAQDPCAELDTEDIVLNIQSTGVAGRELSASDGFIGVRCRGGSKLKVGTLNISRIKNDALQCWDGGVSIDVLEVDHSLPVDYSDANHPDCGQFFSKPLANNPDQTIKPFGGLYIGKADCVVRCYDYEKDKKNGFMFTELCKYMNIVLFPDGIKFDSDSSAPYFIDATNLNGAIIGSEEHPIDPDKVSNKGIRIGGVKDGAPDSSDITIHAYKGLNIVLGEQAETVTNKIWYDKVEEAEEVNSEIKGGNHRRVSPDGVKSLIESEGTVNVLYRDEAGYDTIGIGHLITPSEKMSGKIVLYTGKILDYRNGLTTEEVKLLLKHDLREHCSCIDESVNTDINQGQFDALAHFVFNVGISGFKGSTLLKRINADRFDDVPAEFRKWNKITVKVNGKKVKRISKGLVNRREKVVKMWLKATSDGFSIDDYVGSTENQDIGVPVYDAPIATERELRGYGKLKTMVKSRSIWGVIGNLLGLGGLGGVGVTLNNKVTSVINDSINDPVGAIKDAQAVTVDAAKLVDGMQGLQDLFLYGSIALVIGLLSVIIVLIARLDDRRKGYR